MDEEGGHFDPRPPPHLADRVNAAHFAVSAAEVSLAFVLKALDMATTADDRVAMIDTARASIALVSTLHENFLQAWLTVFDYHEQERGLDLSKARANTDVKRDELQRRLASECARLDAMEKSIRN